MAQVNCPSSVQACALRIVRRDATGAKVTGATAGYVTDAMARLTITPDIEDGQEFQEKNACGSFIINSRDRDLIKRFDLELDLLIPDPEISELLTADALIVSGGNNIGAQGPALGVAPTDNGVSIEWWTKAILTGSVAGTGGAWFHWAAPWTYWRPSDKEFSNAPLITKYVGYAIENPNFGTGPAAPLFASAITRAIARQRDNTAPPTTQCGYTTIA